MSNVLRIVEGNVYEYNSSCQKSRVFYTKGDAVRADWKDNDSYIEVLLKDGKVIFINRNCQIFKIFN